MNLKHLFYFWKTARSGGVVKAGEALHITPQTISGQIRLLEESLDTQLFARDGRALELTPAGRLAMEYADEMFSLSAELEQALRHHPKGRPVEFRVGVSDAVPKSLAYRLLRPAVDPATSGTRSSSGTPSAPRNEETSGLSDCSPTAASTLATSSPETLIGGT